MSDGYWLEIKERGEPPRRVRLTRPETTIGRGDDNAIVVADRRSSRHHCRLRLEPEGLVLEDLDSRNGTVVKGATVTRVVVSSGDEFSIGKTRFTVREGSAESSVDAETAGAGRTVATTEATLEQTVGASDVRSGVDAPVERAAGRSTSTSDAGGQRGQAAPGIVLEWLDGERKGERVEVAELPFVIGRHQSRNGLCLADQRASGEHARIVEEDGAFYIEDLGSRNGTYVGRRRVTRRLLTPEALLQVGYSRFRVHVPRTETLARAMEDASVDEADAAAGLSGDSPRGLAADEDLGRFDVEAFEGARRSEHPLAVVVIVLILGVICYFSVDVARRVLIRPQLDEPAADNELGDAWSFENEATEPEDAGSAAGPAVPGWRLVEGDRGSLRIRSEFAQYPGRGALHLQGEAAPGALTRAAFVKLLGVRAGEEYRLRGFVRNQGAFAAGFLVEWLREDAGGAVVVDRSFSQTAREPGEVLNVDQVVTAPGSVSRARLSCFSLGGSGRSVFDRVVFSPRGDEPAASEKKQSVLERVYRFGASDDGRGGSGPLSLRLRSDGTMELARGRRVVLPRMWLGLAPELDPEQLGSRLASLRVLTEEESGLSFVAQLPDLQNEAWVTAEGSLFVAAAELTLRVRAVPGRDGGERATEAESICLFFEPRDPSVFLRFPGSGDEGSLSEGIDAGTQREMILGEKGEQVVFGFSPEARLDSFEHSYRRGPDGKERRVVVAKGRGEFALTVSTTSRLEREVTLRLVREAEDLYAAGRVGMAVELLERVPALFPEQSAEIEIATTRVEAWRREGKAALDDLQRDLAALRAAPGPVLYEVLGARARDVATRFDRTPIATRASQLAEEAREFWEGEADRRRQQEIAALHERGRAYFLADRIGLAKLYLSRVVELGPETKWARQAEITLESIAKRRSEHRASYLR